MLGKSEDICTLRQGLRTVEVAAAVIESANTGLTVQFESGDLARS